jgi:uncharacterized protein YjiS (DUF1127 family)
MKEMQMSTMETYGAFTTERRAVRVRVAPSLGQDLKRLWQNFLARRQERRLMARLSRLDPHVLADMGFDPADVYRALEESWDEVAGPRFPRV